MTTGVFCRPVCPGVHLAKEKNVQYFDTIYEALAAGFRPCLRCRPESAPSSTYWIGNETLVMQAYEIIREGFLNDHTVSELAELLNISELYLRKLFQEKLGVSPITLSNTHKVLFAKQLLNDSDMSLTHIALASGFNSLRQFNTTFKNIYDRAPSELRKHAIMNLSKSDYQHCRLLLTYKKPFSWENQLGFYRPRLIPGVECISNNRYIRSIRNGDQVGYIDVGVNKQEDTLEVNLYLNEINQLMSIKQNLCRMFDLESNIQKIYELLGAHPILAKQIVTTPGIRLPASWCAFETGIRAIVNQQISVKAAITILSRIAQKSGSTLPHIIKVNSEDSISKIFPTAEQLIDANLTDVGLPKKRQETIKVFCEAILSGDIILERRIGADKLIKQLCALPGVGEWTANYIVMRGLSEPDAFPFADLGLMKALSFSKPKEVKQIAEAWRPWRAYAAILLWQSLGEH